MNFIRQIACLPIRIYQWTLSPLKVHLFGPGACCRFHPSCSSYALTAILRHGVFKGAWFGFMRLLRCHPWGATGNDPVPPLPAHTSPGKLLASSFRKGASTLH